MTTLCRICRCKGLRIENVGNALALAIACAYFAQGVCGLGRAKLSHFCEGLRLTGIVAHKELAGGDIDQQGIAQQGLQQPFAQWRGNGAVILFQRGNGRISVHYLGACQGLEQFG